MVEFLSMRDLTLPVPPVEMSMSVRAFERHAVALAHAMREVCEEMNMPVCHGFSEGVYTRTIHMPAGVVVIGHKHRTQHPNIILSGRAVVVMNGERVEVKAGDVITSEAGVRKVLFIEEDCKWMTIHANPTNERDIPTLEDYLVDKASATLRDEQLIREFRASILPKALL